MSDLFSSSLDYDEYRFDILLITTIGGWQNFHLNNLRLAILTLTQQFRTLDCEKCLIKMLISSAQQESMPALGRILTSCGLRISSTKYLYMHMHACILSLVAYFPTSQETTSRRG
jgi:hypothetical protein